MEQAKIKDQEKLPKGPWEPSKRGLSRVSRGDSGTGLFERGLSWVSRGDSGVGLLQRPAIRNEPCGGGSFQSILQLLRLAN